MDVPQNPKIYHITHVNRLPPIVADGFLWCDAVMNKNAPPKTTIGISRIKHRRLNTLTLGSHPGLHVGDCVPFYFCPRSVMLYVIHCRNHPDLETYKDGQKFILHLEADLYRAVEWADQNKKRWAFTSSNAGSNYFEDYCSLSQLDQINWNAVKARQWGGDAVDPSIKEGKQAEFLVEDRFPWNLIDRIGVYSEEVCRQVTAALSSTGHKPHIQILPDWYY